jgi:superkiller protein 3
MNLGLLLLQNHRAADALPHLQAGAEARPGDFQTQLFYARALAQGSKPAEAIAVYQKAAELDAKAPEAVVEPAEILAGLERFDEAAAAYERAAQLDPRLEQAVLQVAEQMEAKGLREKALPIYQRYLAAHPEAAATRERVGFLLMELQRYPEAIAELERVVTKDGTAANRAALAQAYALNKEPEKALPAWKEAVDADPASADLHLRYANALLFAQSFPEAAQHYLEAVKRNAALVEAWNGLAFSLYRVENYQGALKALDESNARASEKPANMFLRAIIQDKLQLYEEAKASYEKFLAQGAGMEDEEFKSRERLKVIHRLLEKRR